VAANGTFSLPITMLPDLTTEGVETLTLTAAGVSGSVVINDTSLNPVFVTTVTPTPLSVAEGGSITFTVATTAPNGTYAYTLSGSTATSGLDFTAPAALTMNVASGVGTVTIATLPDTLTTEGTETLQLNVLGATGTASITDVVPGAPITLTVGSNAPVTATAAAETYSLKVADALLSTTATQIDINGFDATLDSLMLDLLTTTQTGAQKLSALIGLENITVQENPIDNQILITFGFDANGDAVAIKLLGASDPALVNVTVI